MKSELIGKYNYLGCCMPKFGVFETEQASFCLEPMKTVF